MSKRKIMNSRLTRIATSGESGLCGVRPRRCGRAPGRRSRPNSAAIVQRRAQDHPELAPVEVALLHQDDPEDECHDERRRRPTCPDPGAHAGALSVSPSTPLNTIRSTVSVTSHRPRSRQKGCGSRGRRGRRRARARGRGSPRRRKHARIVSTPTLSERPAAGTARCPGMARRKRHRADGINSSPPRPLRRLPVGGRDECGWRETRTTDGYATARSEHLRSLIAQRRAPLARGSVVGRDNDPVALAAIDAKAAWASGLECGRPDGVASGELEANSAAGIGDRSRRSAAWPDGLGALVAGPARGHA